MYQAIYATKKPTFELLIDAAGQVYMDLDAFDLIVRNLIDNALKATDQPVHIKITANYSSPEYIEVCFEDNAGGMSSAKMATIQRVFAQPERAQISQNGLGLGLAMIGRFVKRNGGSISVESQEGKGTTFRVMLKGVRFLRNDKRCYGVTRAKISSLSLRRTYTIWRRSSGSVASKGLLTQ
jgi:signal transduction histidine kinase